MAHTKHQNKPTQPNKTNIVCKSGPKIYLHTKTIEKQRLVNIFSSLNNNQLCPFVFHVNCKNADCFCSFMSCLFSWRYHFFCGNNGPFKATFMLKTIYDRFSNNCIYQQYIKNIIKSFIDEMNADIRRHNIPALLTTPIINNPKYCSIFIKKYMKLSKDSQKISKVNPDYWSINRIICITPEKNN